MHIWNNLKNQYRRAARLDVLLDSSSQSESEEEERIGGAEGGAVGSAAAAADPSSGLGSRGSVLRTTLRNLTRRENLTDYFDHESYLQVSRKQCSRSVKF
jgi:hypothetical protein